jgi:hypothetical protein
LRPYPALASRPAAVHIIARFAFWTIFLLALTNALGQLVWYLKSIYGEQFELAIFPVTFAIMAALVLVFSRGRHSSPILVAAWVSWLLYFLGGFLGTEQLTVSDIRTTLQVTLKPLITLVGLPWLALRAVGEDKFPRLIHATVLFTCVGAVIAFVQVFVPGFMQDLTVEAGRGSGFWLNPNTSGLMCVLVLFLSLVHPFQGFVLNWITRLLLIAGVAVSFSRTAILALIVGWVVYGVMAKRFRSLVATAFALVLFFVSMFAIIEGIEAVSENQAGRLSFVRSFLAGDWRDEKADNRTELWRSTFLAIERKGALLFGLGHGSAGHIVDGYAPHNYYLYVLGNSGMIALIGLLAWNLTLAQQAWKCSRPRTRAALLAIAAILPVVQLFDHSLYATQSTGAILACFALAVCFGRTTTVRALHFDRSLSLVGDRRRQLQSTANLTVLPVRNGQSV